MILGKTEDAMFAISSVNPFCSIRHIHVYIYINIPICELILFPFFVYIKKTTGNRIYIRKISTYSNRLLSS